MAQHSTVPALVTMILSRHSVSPRRLVAPGPDRAQIMTLIEAAAAAPDHRQLRPWRFIHIRAEGRAGLADLFAAAARETHGEMSESELGRAREKAMNGACLIAVIARIRDDVPAVPPHEQWASVGAAMQNLLLAATAMGFGSMIVSGGKVATHALPAGLGLGPEETLLGLAAIGTPARAPHEKSRPDPASLLTDWPPESPPPQA